MTLIYAELENSIRGADDHHRLRDKMIKALRDVAAGRLPVAAVRHPLGFTCFPLYRDNVEGVCVHAWSPVSSAETDAAPVHCHSWDLRSYVLYGTVWNDRVRVVDAPRSALYRVFRVTSRPGTDDIRATPRLVRCVYGLPERYRAGQSYTVPAGEFHRTLLPDEPTATVVLGRHQPTRSDLIVAPLLTTAGTTDRERHTDQDSRRIARQVADRLAALPAQSGPGSTLSLAGS